MDTRSALFLKHGQSHSPSSAVNDSSRPRDSAMGGVESSVIDGAVEVEVENEGDSVASDR